MKLARKDRASCNSASVIVCTKVLNVSNLLVAGAGRALGSSLVVTSGRTAVAFLNSSSFS